MSFRGLILTVGVSPDPLVHTLEAGRPPFVLFVVSESSKAQVESEVLPRLEDYTPQYNFAVVPDHQNIETAYRAIRPRIAEWLEERNLQPDEVYVDITGGTKPMVAALTLAAVEKFNRFTYVGGDNRSSGGLGVVVSGSERLVPCQNPLNALAVRELERASWLLSEFHADAAADVLDGAAGRCDDALRCRLEAQAGLARALGHADRFDFDEAHKTYRRHGKSIELLDHTLHSALEGLDAHWMAVHAQVKDTARTPGRETLLELLANAERRAHQRRFDDAVGRLYRAVELRGQQLLRDAFGAEFGKIRLDRFPDEHRTAVIDRFGRRSGDLYDLGVQNLFTALRFSQDEALRAKSEIASSLKSHLGRRNNSLLAHGSAPVPERAFGDFWNAALGALTIDLAELPRWPSLELKLP